VQGDPVRVSVCHCLACQRRTGSAFGVQARWPVTSAQITGEAREYLRVSDEGDEERRFYFCPVCGGTVYYFTEPEFIAIPVGALADPDFPEPKISLWESRSHAWVTLPESIEHHP
jgi:hypothetical protein